MTKMDNKRVLFLHHVSSIGGGSYCLLNLLANIDTTIFKPIVGLKTDGPLVEEIRKLGIEVIFFKEMRTIPYNQSLLNFRNILSYLHVFTSLRQFKKIIIDNKIEYVYLNNMMLAPYLFTAKHLGCGTVIHIREHWPLNEHLYQLRMVRNLVYNYCDKLIAINKYSASIFPQKESNIVYDWIDMQNRYKYMPLDEIFGENVSKKKVLLFTGGITAIKGVDYIVNAFKHCCKGDEFRLLILGEPDYTIITSWKQKIRSVLEKIGRHYYAKDVMTNISTDSRIKCIPSVYELCHIMEQSYCFVSYFRMPHANLALVESIIMEKPCIAAENEEALEYTHNGEYAMLVSPNNQELFNQKFQEFLSNIDDWKMRSIQGSRFVSKLFSKEENVCRHREIMMDLINLKTK